MAWRCHDCFGSPVYCTHCIQECHQVHPFHRVSRWNGVCFTPSSLSNAGLTLNLGHGGSLCPAYNTLMRQTAAQTMNSQGSKAGVPDKSVPSSSDDVVMDSSSDDAMMASPDNNGRKGPPLTVKGLQLESISSSDHQNLLQTCPLLNGSDSDNKRGIVDPIRPGSESAKGEHLGNIDRFWEIPGSEPYEMTDPVDVHGKVQDAQPSPETVKVDLADDPFFANESEEEEEWKKVDRGGLPLKIKHSNRKYDRLHCPLLIVVDTTGIHEMRVRFCQCQSLKINPLQNQLMSMGLYASSSIRTRTVFTFRVLHHFDITNLEGKTTAWQYYCTLKRLTSNVFPSTVSDRYRELMRALRQWRDLSSRRRAGVPLDPSLILKPGDLALFCPACPQPGINLPDNWADDEAKFVLC